VEARAINICRSGPPSEYAEDSEEDETPLRICEVEYEQGDRLFMTRILPEPAVEDLRATSTISQKLAEGARRASETWKGLLTLPNCVKGFESVFAKENFDILPAHRQWDHTIELVLGLEPKSSKVYPLSLVEQKELDSFLEENLRTGRIRPSKSPKAAFWTNRGLFEPLVMFFGMTNSLATFQTMMNNIFRDLIAEGIMVVYLDDILIFTRTEEEHTKAIRQVL